MLMKYYNRQQRVYSRLFRGTLIIITLRTALRSRTAQFHNTGELLTPRTARCDSLVVRTQYGLQSANLEACKTKKTRVHAVCLPLCGSTSFEVGVAHSAGDDEVSRVPVKKCDSTPLVKDEESILVVLKTTRIFNGFHMYHVLNNFVVNLDPDSLDKYVFHCWDCEVKFSAFFDKVLNVNARFVKMGCFSKYIFLGENYATYNVDRDDQEKSERWRAWAQIFKRVWCPTDILPFDGRYFTILDRSGAQNGRNMHKCSIPNTTRSRYVRPALENIQESSHIFCNSRLIVSAEGNGLTNMLLLPPQSVVVVLWQTNRDSIALKVIYGNMAKLLGMTMVPIPLESDDQLNVNCTRELNELFKALI